MPSKDDVIIRFADPGTALNICHWLMMKKTPFSYKPGEFIRVNSVIGNEFKKWMDYKLYEAQLWGKVEILTDDPLISL